MHLYFVGITTGGYSCIVLPMNKVKTKMAIEHNSLGTASHTLDLTNAKTHESEMANFNGGLDIDSR